MATIVAAPPALSGDLSLFHTTDPLLANSPILLFYGPAATVGAASSRIQLHIFTTAGHASYTRLAVSPTSSFYSAVTNLPREEQGDEICRSIAFGLRRYFEELSTVVKDALRAHAKSASPQMLWGDNHVAILASRLKKVENKRAVASDIVRCYAEQKLSWLDVDIKLPPGTIKEPPKRSDSGSSDELDEYKLTELRYGKYADLVARFGDITFMPTSRVRRAPSKVSLIGRSASFMRQQKENARKEVEELVGTEISYVDRLHDLRSIRDSKVVGDLPSTSSVHKIFPTSLDDIIAANEELLQCLETITQDTAESSSNELRSMPNEQPNVQQIRQDLLADNQGIGAISQCLVERLPALHDCYGVYMREHIAATKLLRSLVRSSDGDVQAALHGLGEQKLTSLLIEPVQRLPRYTLFIDSISKQLPARHPALKHLMKARDVVSNICEQSGAAGNSDSIVERLKASVDHWPETLSIPGRLVTAVDVVELLPPFSLDDALQKQILLLFTSGVLLLDVVGGRTVPARALMTELESLSVLRNTPKDFLYKSFTTLSSIQTSESHDGQSIQLVQTSDGAGIASKSTDVTTLLLHGAYEGKAARFVEELVKARVEARFSETEREGTNWEVRTTDPASAQLSLLSAVFEDSNAAHVSQRQDPAAVQVLIDIDKHSRKIRASPHGPHTVVTISPLRGGNYRLSVDTIHGPGGSDQISAAEIPVAIQRKLTLIYALRASIDQPEHVHNHIARHRAIMQSIKLDVGVNDEPMTAVSHPAKAQRPRPLSPVKMLSSLLSSTNQPPNTLKKEPSGSNIMAAAAALSMLPASRSNTSIPKPGSREGRPPSREQSRPVSVISAPLAESFDPTKRLQDTLSSYILALKARKGNIVGRSLKSRATADELAVNELYNTMLENSQMMVSAAQAPVDILFAAFEKFLHVAWAEQCGPVMPASMLESIQDKAETLFPAEFDEHCRSVLRSQPLPNQRAFKGIISLLNELLDGTGNDADRGALTAAFAELLITEGNPQNFISLIDRFVDDVDTYFGEPVTEQSQIEDGQSAHKRSRSVNTGSLTSNTSSLRKRFGLGLSRENSKTEYDSKGSVWRTLSKSRQREPSPADSLSQSTMQRARSTESEHRALSRPVSQDGPRKDSAHESLQVPTVMPSVLPGLSTIGEHPSFIPTGLPRKKRRSSLSDLKLLDTPFATPQRSMRSPPTSKPADKSLPASPLSSTPSSKGGSLRIHSPLRTSQRPPLPASFRKESPNPSTVIEKAIQALGQPAVVEPGVENVKPSPTRLRQSSNIPALAPRTPATKIPPPVTPVRSGLSERHDAGNIIRKPPSAEKSLQTPSIQPATGSPTKKLKVQSPQKIRDRLQVEQSAIVAAHSHLQEELSKISEELTMTPGRLVPGGSHSRANSSAGNARDIAARVLKMETNTSEQLSQMTAKLEQIKTDVTTSLSVSETKCKKLDELYRESNAENEALYARFNAELARVSKAVKGGDGAEEMKRRLKEQEDEISRLKRENVRLKREVVGLRSQLRE